METETTSESWYLRVSLSAFINLQQLATRMHSEGYGTWPVMCLSVSSITTFASTTRNETTKERYQKKVQHYNRLD